MLLESKVVLFATEAYIFKTITLDYYTLIIAMSPCFKTFFRMNFMDFPV